MLVVTPQSGAEISARAWAQSKIMPSFMPCRSAVQMSASPALVPMQSQRSNEMGGSFWSASAPTNSGEIKAATAVVASTHGTKCALP